MGGGSEEQTVADGENFQQPETQAARYKKRYGGKQPGQTQAGAEFLYRGGAVLAL